MPGRTPSVIGDCSRLRFLSMTERELLLTGIGGQGVQLAARTLGLAVMAEDREVMVFGTYGGSMRGGNSDVTVILADEPVDAPVATEEEPTPPLAA